MSTKMRFCKECNDKTMCNNSNSPVIEKKEFRADLILLKRKATNEFGHMVPHFKK